MFIHRISIDKYQLLDSCEKSIQNIQEEIYNFCLNKWIDGIIINLGKIGLTEIDSDLKLYYQIEYTEIIDKNYLKEQERLQIGL